MTLRRWTEAEDFRLTMAWGAEDIRAIAASLERTPGAVRHHAVCVLHLPVERTTQSMRAVAAELGYSVTCVRAALGHLRLVRRATRANLSARRCRTFGIGPGAKARLLAYLQSVPDGAVRFRKRQVTSSWGPPRHPPACRRCSRTSKAHYAKGFCRNCYRYQDRPLGRGRRA